MNSRLIPEAVGLFTVTNFDDIVVLALFFGRGAGERGAARRIVAGQYLAFTAILAISIAVAYGASFLPTQAIPYLGLIPITFGLWDAWNLWQNHRRGGGSERTETTQGGGPTILKVAATTFGNGGDNISVYIPVFATVSTGTATVYAVVFLVLVGVWCAIGRFLATRPVSAKALDRWGHLLLPVVLIGIGLVILIEGGAFGL
jgi:cadmium resistance protein CadD (predicted permease)